MDNLNHGFAYSTNNHPALQDSANHDEVNPHQSVPYSQLMTAMTPPQPDNLIYPGTNHFPSGRFPLGFAQNIAQGFPHLLSQPICHNLEMQRHRTESIRHPTQTGFGIDMSPNFSSMESSRSVEHLPSFSSIVASAASSISTMEVQRPYDDPKLMFSSPHVMGASVNSIISNTPSFHNNMPLIHGYQENIAENRPSRSEMRPSRGGNMSSHLSENRPHVSEITSSHVENRSSCPSEIIPSHRSETRQSQLTEITHLSETMPSQLTEITHLSETMPSHLPTEASHHLDIKDKRSHSSFDSYPTTEVLSKPEQTRISYPTTDVLSKPEQTRISYPTTEVLSKPEQTRISYPTTEVLSKPEQTRISYPTTDVLSKPEQNRISYPTTDVLSKPEQTRISYPTTEVLSKAEQTRISYPTTDVLSKPEQTRISYPTTDVLSKPEQTRISYPTTEVLSKPEQTRISCINRDSQSPTVSVKQSELTFSDSSNSSQTESRDSMVVEDNSALMTEGNVSAHRSVPSRTGNRSIGISNKCANSSVRFFNKFTPSAIKRQNSSRGSIKFILSGQLEDEKKSSTDSEANWLFIYSHEDFDKETRSVSVQTDTEKAETRIKQEPDDNWCVSDTEEPGESVSLYHTRSMVPNPDPSAKRERLEMAYDNPLQLLSPSFNPGMFMPTRTGENGISQGEGEGRSELEQDEDPMSERHTQDQQFSRKDGHDQNYSKKNYSHDSNFSGKDSAQDQRFSRKDEQDTSFSRKTNSQAENISTKDAQDQNISRKDGDEHNLSGNNYIPSFSRKGAQECFSKKGVTDSADAEAREAIFQAAKEKLDMERMEVNIQIDESQCVLINDQKRWQCHLCSKNYTTKHNLVTHILDHNGIKPHLCRVCGKYFKQLSHLNTHMLTHDNVKPHVCTICSKGFTQVSHLKRHQAVHLGDNKPYKCDVCGRGFAYPSELRVHKERHVPGRDKCLECGEEFGSPRLLKQHQATHEDREELTCTECGRAFRYPSQLRDHQMSHSGSRPHICTECGMDFMKEHHLRAHMFTHSGLRPYTCKECGRSFNQKANLQRHQLIHSSERAFKCELCDKTFTQPQTLKAHMVVHADKKPYQCSLCGKEFGRLHNLQGHMHMHNDSKPYVCFCGSSFTLKGNLNRHKKVKHGLDESTESMEEEAVNFLSSMERAREDREDDNYETEDRWETDPNESQLNDSTQDELRLSRKQRKSKPRKVLQLNDSEDGNMEDNADADGNMIADSISTQFSFNHDDAENTNHKRNLEMFSDGDDIIADHNNIEDDLVKTRNLKRNLEMSFSDNDEDYSGLHVKFRQSTRQMSKCQQFKDEVESCPSDEDEVAQDDDNDWVPSQPRKTRKFTKGAKLDSIIAEKFSKE